MAEFEGVDLVAVLLFPGVPLTPSVSVDSTTSFVELSTGVVTTGPDETGLSLFFVELPLGVSVEAFSDFFVALPLALRDSGLSDFLVEPVSLNDRSNFLLEPDSEGIFSTFFVGPFAGSDKVLSAFLLLPLSTTTLSAFLVLPLSTTTLSDFLLGVSVTDFSVFFTAPLTEVSKATFSTFLAAAAAETVSASRYSGKEKFLNFKSIP